MFPSTPNLSVRNHWIWFDFLQEPTCLKGFIPDQNNTSIKQSSLDLGQPVLTCSFNVWHKEFHNPGKVVLECQKIIHVQRYTFTNIVYLKENLLNRTQKIWWHNSDQQTQINTTQTPTLLKSWNWWYLFYNDIYHTLKNIIIIFSLIENNRWHVCFTRVKGIRTWLCLILRFQFENSNDIVPCTKYLQIISACLLSGTWYGWILAYFLHTHCDGLCSQF